MPVFTTRRFATTAGMCPAITPQQRWYAEERIVVVCREVAGGLLVPRPRSGIASAAGGVLDGSAKAGRA